MRDMNLASVSVIELDAGGNDITVSFSGSHDPVSICRSENEEIGPRRRWLIICLKYRKVSRLGEIEEHRARLTVTA